MVESAQGGVSSRSELGEKILLTVGQWRDCLTGEWSLLECWVLANDERSSRVEWSGVECWSLESALLSSSQCGIVDGVAHVTVWTVEDWNCRTGTLEVTKCGEWRF
ncbi:hypothetical protein Patl1_05684 [Pistacia atlantica]|uniref:Uncharacterized protein n=1 Tax=Pistacia atlantica TaxID=434234 RepID=A0ACC1BW08_9ROSI|nr:hypothetical protein Patl1_05684 [Pistacia atlantica]